MDGKKNRHGLFYFASGSRYEGTFVDGKKNRHGVFTLRVGAVMRGPLFMAIELGRVFIPSKQMQMGSVVRGPL